MKYWLGNDILERDIIEGEAIFDKGNPHPAYRGTKLLNAGGDRLYEVEIIPNTQRLESVIDLNTSNTVLGNVCTIIYRQWDDDTNSWNEMKLPSLLESWGYTKIPEHKQSKQMSAFDRAMKGI